MGLSKEETLRAQAKATAHHMLDEPDNAKRQQIFLNHVVQIFGMEKFMKQLNHELRVEQTRRSIANAVKRASHE